MIRRLIQHKRSKPIEASRQRVFADRIMARYGFARGGRPQLSLVFLRLQPRMMADLVPKVGSNQTFWVNYYRQATLFLPTVVEKTILRFRDGAPAQVQRQALFAREPVAVLTGKSEVYYRQATLFLSTVAEKTNLRYREVAPARVQRQTLLARELVTGLTGKSEVYYRQVTLFLSTVAEKTNLRYHEGAPAQTQREVLPSRVPVAGSVGRTEAYYRQATLFLPSSAEKMIPRYREGATAWDVRSVSHAGMMVPHRNGLRLKRANHFRNPSQTLVHGSTGEPGMAGWAAILKSHQLSLFSHRVSRFFIPPAPVFTGKLAKPQGSDRVGKSPESGARNGMSPLLQKNGRGDGTAPLLGRLTLQRGDGSGPIGLPARLAFIHSSISQANELKRSGVQQPMESGSRLNGGLSLLSSSPERNHFKGSFVPTQRSVLRLRQTRFHTLNHRTFLAVNQPIIPDGETSRLPEVSDEPRSRATPAVTITVREALREADRPAATAVEYQKLFTMVNPQIFTAKTSHSLLPVHSRLVFKSVAADETQNGSGRIRLGNFTRTEANPWGKTQAFQTWVHANPADATLRNAITELPNTGFPMLPGVANQELNAPERIFRQPQLPEEMAEAAVKQKAESGSSVPGGQAAEAAVNRQTRVSEREMERITDTVLRRLERKIAVEKDRRGLF